MSNLSSNLHQLNPDTLITLFELDATTQGVTEILRFHSGVSEVNTDLVFNGNIYYRYPIEASGFEWSSSGTLPRPTLTAANIDGAITSLAMLHGDLLGAKLTRIRTFLKYIDAVNFASGINPSADPTIRFPDEVWTIDRKSKESKTAVEFELSAAFDITGVKLPRRQFVQNSCTWRYRRWNGSTWVYDEPSCPYTGTTKFDAADNIVTDPYQDVCSKKLSSCEKRFNTLVVGNEKPILPFGGFPGVGLIR